MTSEIKYCTTAEEANKFLDQYVVCLCPNYIEILEEPDFSEDWDIYYGDAIDFNKVIFIHPSFNPYSNIQAIYNIPLFIRKSRGVRFDTSLSVANNHKFYMDAKNRCSIYHTGKVLYKLVKHPNVILLNQELKRLHEPSK